jgi:DNA polymerase I-like protein with 3'-5' exonuclease and polymerase domains/uracil-DNA glycosylase
MIVVEWPSEVDLKEGVPLAGYSGRDFDDVLRAAGISRSECFVTWALRTPPREGDIRNLIAVTKKDITREHQILGDKSVMPSVVADAGVLFQEIGFCRPNVIIALGNVSMWLLTGKWGITSWRGSELVSDCLGAPVKVIPTIAPVMLNRQLSYRPVVIHDLKRAKRESLSAEIVHVDYDFIIRASYYETVAVLSSLIREVEKGELNLAIDIETRSGHIACIALAWNTRSAICIPFMRTEEVSGYFSLEEELEIVWLLRTLLTAENCRGIGQNFHYDAQYIFRHWYFHPRIFYDTMIMQHSLFSNMEKGLGYLSSMYCEHHTYWKDEGKTWDMHTGEEQLWRYNCKDAVATLEVCSSLLQLAESLDMMKVLDFQMSLYEPVLETMERGLRLDFVQRGRLALELAQSIEYRRDWINDVCGKELNTASPVQMMEYFYTILQQRPVISRKTKKPTCDDEALHKLAAKEPLLLPLVQQISELRSLSVFNSTFIAAPVDSDGRMRSTFKIAGTDTYRFSSSENAFGTGMNLQNIPKGGETATMSLPNVRKLFIPDEGKMFFDIDLSSADLRIVVWESDEGEMKSMLREGLDPYTEVAKEFYQDKTIDKKDPRRQTFKSFCHGTHYLGTAKGLAERLGLLVHEAERTQAWYFSRFPKIKLWQDELRNQIFSRRVVENIFGYRFNILERIEGTLVNEVAAWIPQSTVAILINHAYRNIYDNLKEVEVLLQVHDSLGGQFPIENAAYYEARILEESAIVLPYADPLIIPVGIKTSLTSWGDCG